MEALYAALPTVHLPTVAVALVSLGALLGWNRKAAQVAWMRRLPAPLAVLIALTAINALVGLPIDTIGSRFGGIPRDVPDFALPELALSELGKLNAPAITIALLGAIESLLSARVADSQIDDRHDPNQELMAQGVANVAAPLFGGFAATGAIARTATSIRNGATSPLAGIVHAVFLLLVILLLAPLAAHVPLAALAAILWSVAWNMADLPHVSRLLRTAPISDRLLLLVTFVLTVFVDLVVAVNVGVVVASLMFMRRMAETVRVEQQSFDDESGEDIKLPKSVLVYRVEGPFFFGAAEKLESTLERVQLGVETVVIRLGRVPFMDATGINTLTEIIQRFQRHRVRVILCGIHDELRGALDAAGIPALVGESNICASMQIVAERVAKSSL
jgi:SulP family sulfate permease